LEEILVNGPGGSCIHRYSLASTHLQRQFQKKAVKAKPISYHQSIASSGKKINNKREEIGVWSRVMNNVLRNMKNNTERDFRDLGMGGRT
jgi:hypothetical protein